LSAARRWLALAAALLAMLLAPTAPLAAATTGGAGTDGQPTLPTIALTLVTASGRHKYSVELARTPAQQEAGLMYRKAMARNRGMLFPFDPPRPVGFWMENTILSLDLIFIDAGGKVAQIAANAKPFSRDIIGRNAPTAAVLELVAGEAARIGLRPGDRAEFKLPK
jgi:uncharacterized membrane protein (UPF0127 family)